MNNYDKLKSIIQQANPEIMKFGVGCKVRWIDRVWTLADTCVKGCWMLTSNKWNSVVIEPEKIESLGRPIRLADVFIAIGGHQPIHFGWGDNGRGYFISAEDKLLVSWNLKDDNLDHQSEDTKQFLINLLTNV